MKINSGWMALLMLAATGGAALAQQSLSGAKAGQDAAAASQTVTGAAAEPVVGSVPQMAADATAGDSHIRIVRLSEVQGRVGLDRNAGRGIEATMRNMPIVEGGRLATGEGVAEVEFEDGSTLRAAPNTLIEFPQLVLRGTGAKATTVKLVKGTMYVSLLKTKGNEFTVQVGADSMVLAPATHLRLDLDGAKVALAVFAGSAEVEAGSSSTLVGKKQTLKMDLGDQGQVLLAKNVVEGQYDAWDKESIGYHQRYSNGSSFASSPYSYGISDLNYYGSFINAGGCGAMWQPYFVSAAWSPYSSGAWAWYSGAGYSWVSPYPWGWMPYHSGSWAFCEGTGWGWRPGTNWVGLQNVAETKGGPMKPRPPLPPVVGRSTVVVANAAPPVVSKVGAPGHFVFENNSAGLGVPRGMGNLGKISSGVAQHGFVSRPVYSAPMGASSSGPAMSGGPVSLRAGVPSGVPRSGPSAQQSSMPSSHAPGGSSSAGAPHSMNSGAPPSASHGSAPSPSGGSHTK